MAAINPCSEIGKISFISFLLLCKSTLSYDQPLSINHFAPTSSFVARQLCVFQGIKQSQVRVLTPAEVERHARGEQGMLWKVNPVNFEAEEWRKSGVRVVIVSPEHQMSINGLEFIKHVVLYSCPTTFLVQLHGRFFRMSPRYACMFPPKNCHIPLLMQLTSILCQHYLQHQC